MQSFCSCSISIFFTINSEDTYKNNVGIYQKLRYIYGDVTNAGTEPPIYATEDVTEADGTKRTDFVSGALIASICFFISVAFSCIVFKRSLIAVASAFVKPFAVPAAPATGFNALPISAIGLPLTSEIIRNK